MDLVAAKNTKVIVTMEHVDKVLYSYNVSESTYDIPTSMTC